LQTSRKLGSASALAWVTALLFMPSLGSADDAPPPANRSEFTSVVRELRRILAPNGVERLQKVSIGGAEQWVSIRGVDQRNPVLLVIHGGPGYPLMPFSWWFARGWEEYFTVVQWDQRGSGKSYVDDHSEQTRRSLTAERMVDDAEEMTAWLRREFGKDKIFVLSHSWGTYMGLKLAERRPEWLYAYIGVAQIANQPESERRGWAFAMEAARRAGNAEAIQQLQSIAPYGAPSTSIALKDMFIERKWLRYFGGVMAYRDSAKTETDAALLAPEYSDEDFAKFWGGNALSEDALLGGVLSTDLRDIRRLRCPLFLFEGRHDFNVNSTVAADWFAQVRAPAKRLVWFENSGHEMMTEEPGKTLVTLVNYVRPIAERAGDVAPIGAASGSSTPLKKLDNSGAAPR
jgi:proline iminopeptidase